MTEALEPFISPEEVGALVSEIAARLRADYAGRDPVLLGVLKGAFVFMADLTRALDAMDMEVDFVQAASYGHRDEPSHEVLITRDVTTEIKGRHVIVVEGIIDRGLTVRAVLDHLGSKGPASLSLCTLLLRDTHRAGREVEYFGRRIGEGFVVGYGMDYKGRYRNLPGVCLLGAGKGPGG
ncbi:MAG: phosphoribosyltransferase [Thermodesulfobacteriota bacterium]